jgi:hypothetical protein
MLNKSFKPKYQKKDPISNPGCWVVIALYLSALVFLFWAVAHYHFHVI